MWLRLLMVSRKQILQFTPATAESCVVPTSQFYFRSLVCSGLCAVEINANMACFIWIRNSLLF